MKKFYTAKDVAENYNATWGRHKLLKKVSDSTRRTIGSFLRFIEKDGFDKNGHTFFCKESELDNVKEFFEHLLYKVTTEKIECDKIGGVFTDDYVFELSQGNTHKVMISYEYLLD